MSKTDKEPENATESLSQHLKTRYILIRVWIVVGWILVSPALSIPAGIIMWFFAAIVFKTQLFAGSWVTYMVFMWELYSNEIKFGIFMLVAGIPTYKLMQQQGEGKKQYSYKRRKTPQQSIQLLAKYIGTMGCILLMPIFAALISVCVRTVLNLRPWSGRSIREAGFSRETVQAYSEFIYPTVILGLVLVAISCVAWQITSDADSDDTNKYQDTEL